MSSTNFGFRLHFEKNCPPGAFIQANRGVSEEYVGKQNMVILGCNIRCIFRMFRQGLQPAENGFRDLGIITQGFEFHLQRAFFQGLQQLAKQTGQVKLILNAGRVDTFHTYIVIWLEGWRVRELEGWMVGELM